MVKGKKLATSGSKFFVLQPSGARSRDRCQGAKVVRVGPLYAEEWQGVIAYKRYGQLRRQQGELVGRQVTSAVPRCVGF